MRLIVGLGNPGTEYQSTRHNVGFLVADRLAESAGVRIERPEAHSLIAHATLEGRPVVLAKPLTFMNLSGTAVRELLDRLELAPADLLVVYDELALPEDSIRIRLRGRSAGHNGIESVLGALGTLEVPRVRVGIAPEHARGDAADFVLRPLRRSEIKRVQEQVDRAADAVRFFLREGPEKAMSHFNRRAPSGEQPR